MTWTVNDAQALRKRDGERRRRMRAKFGQRIEPALSGAMRFAAPLLGNANYRLALTAVARRMNRYRETAFDGYTPSAADIVCSAYFKAGTNWVMHVCYQITQLGEGQFDHIQDEIAWPDAAEPRYWRALADSNASSSPTGSRVIKSHLPAELVPLDSPAKFVAVTRDPLDCAASGFHFYSSLLLGPAAPPPDIWLDFFASDKTFYGPWHQFTATWWAARDRDNVLFLRFEDLKSDTEDTVRKIAAFLDIDLSPDQVQRVLDRTSFEAMHEINDRFTPVRQNIWSNSETKIIRKGAVGDGGRLFSDAAIARFRDKTSAGLVSLCSDFPHYDLLPVR